MDFVVPYDCEFLTAPGPAHHARADAAGVAVALQHLLRTKKLNADDFTSLAQPA